MSLAAVSVSATASSCYLPFCPTLAILSILIVCTISRKVRNLNSIKVNGSFANDFCKARLSCSLFIYLFWRGFHLISPYFLV